MDLDLIAMLVSLPLASTQRQPVVRPGRFAQSPQMVTGVRSPHPARRERYQPAVAQRHARGSRGGVTVDDAHLAIVGLDEDASLWNAADSVAAHMAEPEPHNGRLRDELLNGWQFDSLLEAQVLIEDHRIDYNINRPHSVHRGLTPVEFAHHWTATHQTQPA